MIGGLGIGGSQSVVMNLFRNIDRSKIMFDFIVDHPKNNYFEREILSLGGKIFIMPTFNGRNVCEVKRKWDEFFAEHPEYMILHSHVRSYASFYLPIAKKHGLKTIIHSHSTSNGKGFSSIIKRILQYPLRHQADYLMACSNEAGRWLYGDKACRKSNYIFLPNAIKVEDYCYSLDIAKEVRKELDLQNKFVIGHIGRLHKAKNHSFLLNVFARVCQKCPNAMLLLVGDGELRGEIEAKIRELKIEDCVIMTGGRSDVSRLMQAMDIFVFPSLWEGLPVAIIEAQASGMHCIISDRITKDVDVSELVERLPITDVNVWVNKILRMDKTRLNVIDKIKEAGFDVSDSAKKLTDFYLSIGEKNG